MNSAYTILNAPAVRKSVVHANGRPTRDGFFYDKVAACWQKFNQNARIVQRIYFTGSFDGTVVKYRTGSLVQRSLTSSVVRLDGLRVRVQRSNLKLFQREWQFIAHNEFFHF